jgi:hypothetical protein
MYRLRFAQKECSRIIRSRLLEVVLVGAHFFGGGSGDVSVDGGRDSVECLRDVGVHRREVLRPDVDRAGKGRVWHRDRLGSGDGVLLEAVRSEGRDVERDAVMRVRLRSGRLKMMMQLLLLERQWSFSNDFRDGIVDFLFDDLLLFWRRCLDWNRQAWLGRRTAALERNVGRSVHRVAPFLFRSRSVVRCCPFALAASRLLVLLVELESLLAAKVAAVLEHVVCFGVKSPESTLAGDFR